MSGKRYENGTGVNEGPKGSKGKIQENGVNLFEPQNRNGEESLKVLPFPKGRRGALTGRC